VMTSGAVLSIIVPCYNPDPGWEVIVIEKFLALNDELKLPEINLTIVNDGSLIGINEGIISHLKTNIPSLQWISYSHNHGKGYALREGVKASEGDYFIYTDIDFPYTINSMAAIYNNLVAGADVVVGIREREYYDKVPARRIIISKFVKKLIKYLLNTDITDTQCGLKGFNKKGKKIFLETSIDRFPFDMQFVKFASRDKSLVIKPQLVYSRPGIVFSHMNYKVLLGESWNFMRLIIK
jgi:glycosyltransferase involved in cell wall biosynthesis